MNPQLGPEEWSKVFDRLARELPPTGQRRVMVIGGVAMALGYKSRRALLLLRPHLPCNGAGDRRRSDREAPRGAARGA